MKRYHDNEPFIVSLLKNNKERATKEIFSTYSGLVSGICARFLSDDDDIKDVAQESFVKIFTSLGSFSYSGEGSLTAWIRRVTVNRALNYLRDNNRIHFSANLDEVADVAIEPPDTEALTADEIAGLIRGLPDGYRTVFNLYAIEGKTHKEIARLLGIKENSSASQYLRARALLAIRIKDYLKRK